MKEDSAENSTSTKRRVYDLPNELVERIITFQKDKGLPSEVEAVRRLLDQALKSRDTIESLVGRFLASWQPGSEASVVAAHILAGHPLVKGIDFNDDETVSFRFQRPNEEQHTVWPKSINEILIDDGSSNSYELRFQAHVYHPSREPGMRLVLKSDGGFGGGRNNIDNDEIPF